MNPIQFKPESIFHPADFSTGHLAAFAHALRLAVAAGAELRLLHVDEHDRETDWSSFPHIRPLLESWQMIPPGSGREAVARLGVKVQKIQAGGPEPVEAILSHLAHHPPDLVVLSTHQRQGLERFLHRAVAEPVARRSGVLTLFVPRQAVRFINSGSGAVALQRILVPVAHEPAPQAAIDAAVGLGALLGAANVQMDILHVGHEADSPAVAAELPRGWRLERVHRSGDVAGTILMEAAERKCDLIAMATRGHQGILDALLGSTTERVLRGTTCPLLAVPTRSGR
jgi:nucleotide-binding universal stress UspA family protein